MLIVSNRSKPELNIIENCARQLQCLGRLSRVQEKHMQFFSPKQSEQVEAPTCFGRWNACLENSTVNFSIMAFHWSSPIQSPPTLRLGGNFDVLAIREFDFGCKAICSHYCKRFNGATSKPKTANIVATPPPPGGPTCRTAYKSILWHCKKSVL